MELVQAAESSPWMPSWGEKSRDSLGCAELCQVDRCAATFAACGHVAGFDFLFFCLFGVFYPCRNKHVKTTWFSFAHNCSQRDNTNHVWFRQDWTIPVVQALWCCALCCLIFQLYKYFSHLQLKWLVFIPPVTLTFLIWLSFPGWFCKIHLDVGVSRMFIFHRLFGKTPFIVMSNIKHFEKSNS